MSMSNSERQSTHDASLPAKKLNSYDAQQSEDEAAARTRAQMGSTVDATAYNRRPGVDPFLYHRLPEGFSLGLTEDERKQRLAVLGLSS
jgi:hypothetical protein